MNEDKAISEDKAESDNSDMRDNRAERDTRAMRRDKVTKSVAEAIAAQRAPPKLPRRFYKQATVVARGSEREQETGFAVRLDGRVLRTPGRVEVIMPREDLAQAVAAEWAGQGEDIDLSAMPLTRLSYRALDVVHGHEDEIRAEIIKYAGSDLLCYRADHPQELVARQNELWDPVLAWAAVSHDIDLTVATGIVPVRQSIVALERLEQVIAGRFVDAFSLNGVHVITTLCGSALLAFAVAQGHLSADQAWRAAHVDEDWQIEKWGEDDEAMARRSARYTEFQAAIRLLDLLH